jgi:hypothetical protein
MAARGWIWSVARGGLEHLPLAVKLIGAVAHVLIVATIVTELGARILVRQRSQRKGRSALLSRQDNA